LVYGVILDVNNYRRNNNFKMKMENKTIFIIMITIFGVVFISFFILFYVMNKKLDTHLDENCDYVIIINHGYEPLDCYDFISQTHMDEHNKTGIYCFTNKAKDRLYAECER